MFQIGESGFESGGECLDSRATVRADGVFEWHCREPRGVDDSSNALLMREFDFQVNIFLFFCERGLKVWFGTGGDEGSDRGVSGSLNTGK